MGRRKFKRTRSASTPAASVASSDNYLDGVSFSFGGSGYSGADHSMARRYVYFPQMDTRRQLPPLTREQLMKKARWLYENMGIARRIVEGVTAIVVGPGIMPVPNNSDENWNQKAREIFAERAFAPRAFSQSGDYDFFTGQQVAFSNMLKDGDVFLGLGKTDAGSARIAFYTANRVTSRGSQADERMYDGLILGRGGRTLGYNFYDPITNQEQRVHASNVIHLADRKVIGLKRGVSVLSFAINHLLDISETLSYVKSGLKSSNAIAYAITSSAGASGPANPFAAALTEKSTVKDSDGNEYTTDRFFGGGAIPSLPPGVDIKMLNDTRPHPNQQSFFDYLVRDISWGVGLAPDILWDIAKAGGTGIRYAMADLQAYASMKVRMMISGYCWPLYAYMLACEIAAGNLEMPSDGKWWAARWIPPARRTIDIGRDGRMYAEMYADGHISQEDMCAWTGGDWQQLVNQRVKEYLYKRKICEKSGLTYETVFGSESGTPNNETMEFIEELKVKHADETE